MADFYRYLYRSGNISKVQIDYIKQCTDEGRMPANYYAIAVSLPEKERITIYPSLEWNSSRVDREHSQVIGIGRTFTASKYLILQLAKDCYSLRKDADILSYLTEMDPDTFAKEEA